MAESLGQGRIDPVLRARLKNGSISEAEAMRLREEVGVVEAENQELRDMEERLTKHIDSRISVIKSDLGTVDSAATSAGNKTRSLEKATADLTTRLDKVESGEPPEWMQEVHEVRLRLLKWVPWLWIIMFFALVGMPIIEALR